MIGQCMTKDQVISKELARQLKPYLKYMDFGGVRPDRKFLVEKVMYQNLLLGNIKFSLIDELRKNYMQAHPNLDVPDILKISS